MPFKKVLFRIIRSNTTTNDSELMRNDWFVKPVLSSFLCYSHPAREQSMFLGKQVTQVRLMQKCSTCVSLQQCKAFTIKHNGYQIICKQWQPLFSPHWALQLQMRKLRSHPFPPFFVLHRLIYTLLLPEISTLVKKLFLKIKKKIIKRKLRTCMTKKLKIMKRNV